MGRLAGMKVYCIGAMDRVADGGEGWRKTITPYLQSKGTFVLDPSDKPLLGIPPESANREHINELKASGNYALIRELYADSIRGNDLRFVDESSFLVCYLDIQQYPCGTYEEFFWAIRQKKPVLTVVAGGKKATPNWMLLCQPHEFFFDSFEDMKHYINHIDTDEKVETFGRWRFFDWSRLVKETTRVYGQF